jgi:hypothetical protein
LRGNSRRGRFFSQCDAVLDIGANRGMFSTALALAAKGIPFHAFEPLPTLHAELERQDWSYSGD